MEFDEDCDDENGGFRGEEGDENVFYLDVYFSSEEILYEDELGEIMMIFLIRYVVVFVDIELNEDKNMDC